VPRATLPPPARVESGKPQPVASVPPVAAAPAPGKADPDRVALIERDYLSRLAALIERYRFYPRTSRRLREEGTVVVRLVLAPDGAFSELAVADSSGRERLDRAALETLQKVTRFDPIPALLGRERWQIEVPIIYRLR
jgi:protein TonB